MLGPHFAEGGRLRSTTPNSCDPVLQVTAEDEFDPTALATVLYVLHAKPQYIPRTVTSENLLDIAIVCNYYDCAPAMRPWDDFWIKSASSVYQQPGYEYWLFISWVFGESNIFGQLTKTFLRNSVIENGEFGVMVKEKLVRMDPHLPQPIIGTRASKEEIIVNTNTNFYSRYGGLAHQDWGRIYQRMQQFVQTILRRYTDKMPTATNPLRQPCICGDT
jgi:hypothetical protein